MTLDDAICDWYGNALSVCHIVIIFQILFYLYGKQYLNCEAATYQWVTSCEIIMYILCEINTVFPIYTKSFNDNKLLCMQFNVFMSGKGRGTHGMVEDRNVVREIRET